MQRFNRLFSFCFQHERNKKEQNVLEVSYVVSNVPAGKGGQYQLLLPLYLGWVYCLNAVVRKKRGQGLGREGGNNKDRMMCFFLTLLAVNISE